MRTAGFPILTAGRQAIELPTALPGDKSRLVCHTQKILNDDGKQLSLNNDSSLKVMMPRFGVRDDDCQWFTCVSCASDLPWWLLSRAPAPGNSSQTTHTRTRRHGNEFSRPSALLLHLPSNTSCFFKDNGDGAGGLVGGGASLRLVVPATSISRR